MPSLPPQATFVVTYQRNPCRPKITVKLGPLLLKTERAIRHEVVGCVFKAAGVCKDACEASGGTKMVDKVVEAIIAEDNAERVARHQKETEVKQYIDTFIAEQEESTWGQKPSSESALHARYGFTLSNAIPLPALLMFSSHA